jgi:hypothetical protein
MMPVLSTVVQAGLFGKAIRNTTSRRAGRAATGVRALIGRSLWSPRGRPLRQRSTRRQPVATLVGCLNAQAVTDEPPRVSAECAEYVADIETQLAKSKADGNDDGVLAFSRTRVGADDCSDDILDHFSGDR